MAPRQPPLCSAPYKSEPILLENSLKLFELDEPAGDTVEGETCQAVRLVRAHVAANSAKDNPAVDAALKKIIASGMLNVDRLNQLRAALSVEAKYDSRVSVRLGGREWLSTGDAVGGLAGATWPCANTAPPAGGCDYNGIRCANVNCSILGARNNLNMRLLDAFSALELISQSEVLEGDTGLESHIEFWLPVTVDYGLRPQDVRRIERRFDPASVFQNAVAYEWYNSKWRIYTPNGPF